MNPLVAHFASGEAYLSGMALLLVGLCLAWRSRVPPGVEPSADETRQPPPATGTQRVVRLLLVAGCLLASLSAVPTPLWLVALLLLAGAGCLWLQRASPSRVRSGARIGLVLLLLTAAALEAPRHLEPNPLQANRKRLLYVIGDSISAGMGVHEETWPQRLSRTRGAVVVDLSQPGATAKSALEQAEWVTDPEAIVLVEIGGNDLLGSTSVEQYAAALEELLKRVCAAKRMVYMLALPLPPLHNAWAATQRDLARRYGATLVPRRFLIRAISAGTLDGLHLGPGGHSVFADGVWRLLGPSLELRVAGAPPPPPVIAVTPGGELLLGEVGYSLSELVHHVARRWGGQGETKLHFARQGEAWAIRRSTLERLARAVCLPGAVFDDESEE